MTTQAQQWLADRNMGLELNPSGTGWQISTTPFSEMPRSGPGVAGVTAGAMVVLEPVVKAIPVKPSVVDLYPGTIIPPAIEAPTASLVGYDQKGGNKMPWTNGPAALAPMAQPIGSLLFCIGNSVAVSIALGAWGAEIMGQVKSNYHRRGVTVKVHTGIGSAGNMGTALPESVPALPVPFNAPVPQAPRQALPPGFEAEAGHAPGWLGSPGSHGAWGPFLGIEGLPAGPSVHELAEFFEWVAPWAIEFGSWLF